MKVAVPRETAAGEARVAATPDTVKRLVGLGASVAVQAGAGVGSRILDEDYVAAGATIAPTSC
jgi:NAD(P) transhydrogenase subunit alpha